MANRGSSTVANMDPYKVPWFADCAPSLLTNRTIRRYLNAYSQHTWPEVIKLTLIYGVLGLEQQFPGGTLSIPQLRKLVERGGAQLVVERNLPGLQRQILTLQTGLDAVFDRLAVEPPAPAGPGGSATTAQQLVSTRAGSVQQQQPAAAPHLQPVQRGQQQQQQQVLEVAPRGRAPSARSTSALNPGPVAPKPPDEWRLGEKTGFPSPPRTRDHPLRRSLDNQGATNPIYPDWWLAAGPPEPPPPKAVPKKVPRKQPRLAYSVQQQPEASAAADDLVTAEYLMVPGSGYGQAEPEAVVAGAGPSVLLTSITADTMQTNPLVDAGRQPAAAVSGPAAARAGGPQGALTTAGAGRVPRRPQAAQSKIKEAVAASRRKAAAQQQRRQQLLASAVAAGSSLFGATQQLQPPRRTSAAADAIAACAPAAAAEQFLSNPWMSSFLQPSALRADVVGYTQLPAADITADDEARLGPLEGQELGLEELQQPRAPAAYAVLKRVVAGGNASPAAAAAAAGVDTVGFDVSSSQALSQAGLGPVAEVWSRDEDEQQQEQVEDLLAQPGPSTAGPGTLSKGAAPSTRAAQAGSLRGVFADITSGLNSQVLLQSGKAAAAADGAGPSTRGVAASWAYSAPQAQVIDTAAADAAMQQGRGASDSDDWRKLPLVDEQGELQETQYPLQQQQQQRQHAQQRQHKAWACDYGHLQDVKPPPAKVSARERRAAGRPHKRWSETWVGDFGHLHQFPRFAPETAFQPEGQAAGENASEGSPPSSKLFMSPADLQALVAASDRLQAHTQQTCADATSPEQPADAGMAAAAAAAGDSADSITEADAGSVGASRAVAAAAEASSSAHSLAARFAELLSRWDAEAADSAGQLPAGVAARASVAHAAAGTRENGAAVKGAEAAGRDAAAAEGTDTEASRTSSSSSSYTTAGSDGEVNGGGQQGVAPAAAGAQRARRHEEAAVGAAAADAAELLFNLQQAVSELSSIGDSEAAGAAAEPVHALSATEAAGIQASAAQAGVGSTAAAEGNASAASLPAEGHLEGMQEASQMLQQALSRHDALMQLIASLGGAPGSGTDALPSSAASDSELTM